MNKRLLLVLFLSLPFMASGQTWQLIAQGGVQLNSKTSDFTPRDTYGSPISGMAGMGVSYRKARIEVGIVGGYRRYGFRHEGDIYEFDPLTGYQGKLLRHFKYVEKMPALYAMPFVNYHFKVKKLDCYVGVAPSYVRFFGYSQENPKLNLKDGGNGYGLDLRGGVRLPAYQKGFAIQRAVIRSGVFPGLLLGGCAYVHRLAECWGQTEAVKRLPQRQARRNFTGRRFYARYHTPSFRSYS